MKKPTFVIGIIIIVNACIWGLTMISASSALQGTGAYDEIRNAVVRAHQQSQMADLVKNLRDRVLRRAKFRMLVR